MLAVNHFMLESVVFLPKLSSVKAVSLQPDLEGMVRERSWRQIPQETPVVEGSLSSISTPLTISATFLATSVTTQNCWQWGLGDPGE